MAASQDVPDSVLRRRARVKARHAALYPLGLTWRQRNPDKVAAIERRSHLKNREKRLAKSRNWHSMKKYGLPLDLYKAILAKGCAICGSMKDTVLDHDHKTGDIRDSLCALCNAGLGAFRDNSEILEAAIEYLNQHAPYPR